MPDAVSGSATEATAGGDALTWIADVPLLTNPVVLRALSLVLGISYMLVTAIFGVITATAGRMERLPVFMGAMAIGFLIAAVLIAMVMLVVFRNRMRVLYILDDEGVTSIVVDRKAAIGNSLAVLAGTVSANASLTGAGLIGAGAQREHTAWRRVSEARYRPDQHFIGLVAAGWWPVGAIHCTAESYATVEARVREILDRRAARRREAGAAALQSRSA